MSKAKEIDLKKAEKEEKRILNLSGLDLMQFRQNEHKKFLEKFNIKKK